MKEITKRMNKGYEIQLYYPKNDPNYGNEKLVIQCDNVGEVAQWFARRSWGSGLYGDSNEANPTVFYDGVPWCRYEESAIQGEFYYKGFVIFENEHKHEALDFKDSWHVFIAAKPNEQEMTYVRSCESYAECIERIDNQTI